MMPDYRSGLLFSPLKMRQLHLVVIVIQDTALVPAISSPQVTATSAGGGVYNLTFPKGQNGVPLAATLVGVGAGGGTLAAEFNAFDPVAGTAQIDTGSDLAGGDRCYVSLLVGRA